MRCSLCEKNDCPAGVVCAACEAHYATIREGHLRRQAMRLGEAELAHIAWSLHPSANPKGRRPDSWTPFWAAWWGKGQAAPAEPEEEGPPPPDWKNRVRPAPDGLPPALAFAPEAPAAGGPKTEGDLLEGGPLVEEGPLAPPDVAPPLAGGEEAPVAPLESAQLPEPGAVETPALASFFEDLAAEQAQAPQQPLPVAASGPPEDLASVMSGFLASLEVESPQPPPPEVPAAAPEAPSGGEPLAQTMPFPAELVTPEVDLKAWAQWGQPPTGGPEGLPDQGPQASPAGGDPGEAWEALPELNWGLSDASVPSAAPQAPAWGTWAGPEGASGALEVEAKGEAPPSGLPPVQEASPSPLAAWEGGTPASSTSEGPYGAAMSGQEDLPQGLAGLAAEAPTSSVPPPPAPTGAPEWAPTAGFTSGEAAPPTQGEGEGQAPLEDFFESLGQSQGTAEPPGEDPLAGFFAALGGQAQAEPPSPPPAEEEGHSLSWQLDQVFASMAKAPAEATGPQPPEATPHRKDPLGPWLEVPPEAHRAPLPKGHQPFTIDLGHLPLPEVPQLPPPPPTPKPRVEDPKDGAFSFVLDLSDEESTSLLEGIDFFRGKGKVEEPGFRFHRGPQDDGPEEGRTIDLS